jgi:hypothetical protein
MSCFDEIRLGIDARSSQSIRGRCWRLMYVAMIRAPHAALQRSRGGGAEDVSKRVPDEREKGGQRGLGAGSGTGR